VEGERIEGERGRRKKIKPTRATVEKCGLGIWKEKREKSCEKRGSEGSGGKRRTRTNQVQLKLRKQKSGLLWLR
jgi:hypothetical protein